MRGFVVPIPTLPTPVTTNGVESGLVSSSTKRALPVPVWVILTKFVDVDPENIPELKVLTPETLNCVTDAIPPITLTDVVADPEDGAPQVKGNPAPWDIKVSPAFPGALYLKKVNDVVAIPAEFVWLGEMPKVLEPILVILVLPWI